MRSDRAGITISRLPSQGRSLRAWAGPRWRAHRPSLLSRAKATRHL